MFTAQCFRFSGLRCSPLNAALCNKESPSMEIVTDRLKMTQITDRDWELFESLHRDPAVIRLCFD